MSFYEIDCERCGGYTSHTPTCPVRLERKRAADAAKRVEPKAAQQGGRKYRYEGRVYQIVVQARSPSGPVTLETIDDPKETISTTNDRLAVLGIFEPVGD